MIKEFGNYGASLHYPERNGCYLLTVSERFLFPIIQSEEGYFLLGGKIEEGETPEQCLSREIIEEIGGRISTPEKVCETKTVFYCQDDCCMKRAHNYFMYCDSISLLEIHHEDLKLHWVTFEQAQQLLELDHQKWAVQYFQENVLDYSTNSKVAESVLFIKGLQDNNIELLRKVPKSDIHNHAVFGGTRENYFSVTGTRVKELTRRFDDFSDFISWCDENVSNHSKSKEGFLKRLEAAMITAGEDNIKKLCFNIGACSMKYFKTVGELIESIEQLRKHYLNECVFLPELCLDRNKCTKEYLGWVDQLLESGYFKTIDLVGDETLGVDQYASIYAKAKKKGMILKAHLGEFTEGSVVMRDVKKLNLDQIQHGLSLVDKQEYMAEIREQNIQVNLCPSSNYLFSRISSIKEHPINKLYYHGIRVTVNSDDILVFGSTVSDEYLLLYNERVMTAEELNQIRLNGLD